PPVSPSPIPQPLCEISYPNGVTVRLNSPLSPEVLQTLIFLNSNR
ncbi:IS66 family insertion sequence element accessory protein TnpB, partial [Salmonella enterica subsp. enterica serovar Agona]|nr:IS66 family insertion sequence element accessory protein TnpB [Salmonella enterica subsp. enterica serovar Agona]